MEIQLTFGVTPEETLTEETPQDNAQNGNNYYYGGNGGSNGGDFFDPWSWFFGNFGF